MIMSEMNLPRPILSAPWSDQDFLQLILAAAPIAIVLVDAAGRILYANPKLQEMFDYSHDELAGQSIELLIPERFRMDHIHHRTDYGVNPPASDGIGLDLAGRRKEGPNSRWKWASASWDAATKCSSSPR